jgi:hypothetical protein
MPASKREQAMNARTCRWIGSGGLRAACMLLLILGAAHRGQAESVYKCRNARGDIAYQDHACTNLQQETRIEIAKAPPPAAMPVHSVAARARSNARGDIARPSSRHRRSGNREVLSYECRASNGDVFYRHAGCPKSIKTDGIVRGSQRGGSSATVSAAPLTRSEACRRLASAGSIGRSGHERDEQVSTYDRNAGRDPCRHS